MPKNNPWLNTLDKQPERQAPKPKSRLAPMPNASSKKGGDKRRKQPEPYVKPEYSREIKPGDVMSDYDKDLAIQKVLNYSKDKHEFPDLTDRQLGDMLLESVGLLRKRIKYSDLNPIEFKRKLEQNEIVLKGD